LRGSSALGSDASERAPRILGSVPALDGLRGMAVLIVIAFHSSLLFPFHHRFLHNGGLGVDAFFVLSGFLITALLLREQAIDGRVRIREFYVRRALRLLPALIVLLSAHAIYASIAHLPAARERSSVVSILFYYSNTGLNQLHWSLGLGHLWSLAVEEQFYIVWPLCVVLFADLRQRLSTVLVITVGAIIAVVLYRTALWQHGAQRTFLYTRTITRADSLLVGTLLAQLWVRGRVPTRGLAFAAWPALALYAFLVANRTSDEFFYRGGWTLVAITVAIMILAILESNWIVNRFLRFGPLRLVGRVSYGLYIWHLAIFEAIVQYGSHWAPRTRLGTGLGLTALACGLSWRLVERPFLRWSHRVRPRTIRADRQSETRRPPVATDPGTRVIDPSTP
jgi:peptidoglycan/LPS O-acetylase OafA/YrhL